MPTTPRPFRTLPLWIVLVFIIIIVEGCGSNTADTPGGGGDTGADTTPPTIVSKFPTDNQVNVALNTTLSITFSEPLNPATLTLNTILLTQSGAGNVQRSLEWQAATKTLVVQPATRLGSETQYLIELTDGVKDVVGNRLQASKWYFTTGSLIDFEAPRWRCSALVTAVPLRFDTIKVSWDGQDLTQCSPDEVVAGSPATDNATPADRLTFVVEHKRVADAQFTPSPPQTGVSDFTISGLRASTEYQFRVGVADLAGNKGEVRSPAAPTKTPPSGRLYVANVLGHTLSGLADIGQATGDQPAVVVSSDRTELNGPVSVSVDATDKIVYVANFRSNSIAAYALSYTEPDGTPSKLGQSPIRHNQAPLWTIRGDRSAADITDLSGPTWLWLDVRPDATGKTRKLLYVANAVPVSGRTGRIGNSIAVFDVTTPPSGPNSAPIGVIKSQAFLIPIAFAVDSVNKLLYVVNRDYLNYADNLGGKIMVFPFPNDPLDLTNNPDNTPSRTFWGQGATGGPCVITDPSGSLCGPSALALDPTGQTLYVVNRARNNLLIFAKVHEPTTQGSQTPVVVEGPQSGLENARPTSLFLDGDRLYVATDRGQSLIIFKVADLANGGDVRPLRIIKGSQTMLGQPTPDPAQQSAGASGVAVVANEAYVVTPGFFQGSTLSIPSLSVFDVSPAADPAPGSSTVVTPTRPARLVVNPLQGASGMALDREHNRLYVASFHANMIVVYEGADALGSGQRQPDRIIAGPKTKLDHPVSLVFRPATTTHAAALYVVNQSRHSILVFGGRPLGTPGGDVADLAGDVPFSRYLGPSESTEPFSIHNATELVYPAGIAIDENRDLLYVSNRDATAVQDLAGRKILAFTNASTIGATPAEIDADANAGNVAPAWKIEGDPPPFRFGRVTDRTTLNRPSALLVDSGLDRLFVANRGNGSILVFNGISAKVQQASLDHNLAPTWTITHGSMKSPAGLAINLVFNDLYVADAQNNGILAFDVGRLDSTAPLPVLTPRVVGGPNTALAAPIGIALDPEK